jgi:F-type H+-transporting ATPase subunit a
MALVLFLSTVGNQIFAAGDSPIETKEEYIDQVLHHVQNSNEIHLVGNFSIPLPVFTYSPQDGFMATFSSSFDHGHKAVNGYVLNHGRVNRVLGNDFPRDEKVHVEGIEHHESEDGEHEAHVLYKGKQYELDAPATFMEGSSFYDFSITKNVATMFLAVILLFWLFGAVAKSMARREGQAPSGVQSFMEPFVIFIRDEIAKPFIGDNHERYLSFIMSLFYFILILNLLGLVPFLGSANVTGNAGTTLALALLTFVLMIAISTKDFWVHMLWMPGVPIPVRFVLAIIELVSLVIKPVTLFIRLGANITAGHIAILAMVGIIFIFSDFGNSLAGGGLGLLISVPFTIAMNLLEIFVALLQAFIFALLSALYIGQALERHAEH